MSRIDETRPFIPVSIAVLTVSDTRDIASDKSGATLVGLIENSGHSVAERAIVKDDVDSSARKFKAGSMIQQSTSSSRLAARASPAAM